MNKTIAEIIIVGALLAGCATRTSSPTATPTQGEVAPAATAVPPTEVPSATPTESPTSSPTATPIPEPTNAPTAVPTYMLSGTVFFDYNGNGLRDEDEPPIGGVPISLAGLSTTSGADGGYSLAGVAAGNRQVCVESPTQDPRTAFRYVSLSMAAFQPVNQPLRVDVGADKMLDIALMQGYLTSPFKPEIPICVISYFDLEDIGPDAVNYHDGVARDWMGNTTIRRDITSCTPGEVYDAHPGIDYAYGPDYAHFVAFEVYAGAPGAVVGVGRVDPRYRGG